MKTITICFIVFLGSFSSLQFASAETSNGIAIPGIFLSEENQSTIMRRCVDDRGCRPGVEMCTGGQCVPTRGEAPRCRIDRDCAPRQCIGGRCQ